MDFTSDITTLDGGYLQAPYRIDHPCPCLPPCSESCQRRNKENDSGVGVEDLRKPDGNTDDIKDLERQQKGHDQVTSRNTLVDSGILDGFASLRVAHLSPCSKTYSQYIPDHAQCYQTEISADVKLNAFSSSHPSNNNLSAAVRNSDHQFRGTVGNFHVS